MLERLKRISLRRNMEKHLEQRDISHRNGSLKHLAFLIEENFQDSFELFYEFGNRLGLQQENIKVFTFIRTKERIPNLSDSQISSKDFSLMGEIQNQNALNFLEYPFDAMIGYYAGKQSFLEAMIAKSKANFKIGFAGTDSRLYDLLLSIDPSNFELASKEIEKYLKVLKKI